VATRYRKYAPHPVVDPKDVDITSEVNGLRHGVWKLNRKKWLGGLGRRNATIGHSDLASHSPIQGPPRRLGPMPRRVTLRLCRPAQSTTPSHRSGEIGQTRLHRLQLAHRLSLRPHAKPGGEWLSHPKMRAADSGRASWKADIADTRPIADGI
jgi:hypothetical protein